MISISVLCSLASLLQAATSRSLLPGAEPDNSVPVPKLNSDLKRGDTPAQWASGYPKKWGSEDFSLQFNVPEPDDIFAGVVTTDEKYVAMFNGSHVTFVDLDTKAAISTFNFEIPSNVVAGGLTLRPTPQGGYDVLTSGGRSRYNTPYIIFHKRVGSDLQPTGSLITYESGEIGDIHDGKMATTNGHIYDLDDASGAAITFMSPPRITAMSFSGDGKYISTVGWQDMSADLWNASSGEKILQFPATKAQNWDTKFSPNNQYIVLSLGSGSGGRVNGLQIYTLGNLTAPPTTLGPFNGEIRTMAWSPDSAYLATGDNGRMQLFSFPGAKLVQTWQVDTYGAEALPILDLGWLNGGKKISWVYLDGRYMFDFETGAKWWWNPGYEDHSWGTAGVQWLGGRGLVATMDGDSKARFWKV